MDGTANALKRVLRIVWAIAAKDIIDALKNRTVIALIIGLTLTMLTGRALPLLLQLSDTTTVFVYDQGDSALADELESSDRYRVAEARSQQELEEILLYTSAEVLGIVVPADFTQTLEVGGEPEIEGYVVWAGRSAAPELQADLEQTLAEQLGQPVHIDIAGNIIYPPPEGMARQAMVAMVLVLTTFVIGGFLIPYLMFEEKEARTMDVLLVSPANAAQIVVGKALAGLFYCLIAIAVALAFNAAIVVDWGIAALAAVSGALFAVAVGLLLGSLFETPQQMGLWVGVPLLILVLPILLDQAGRGVPAPFDVVTPWLPTVAQANIFKLSFSGQATLARALPDLAIVLGSALLGYLAVAWLVRRSDR